MATSRGGGRTTARLEEPWWVRDPEATAALACLCPGALPACLLLCCLHVGPATQHACQLAGQGFRGRCAHC